MNVLLGHATPAPLRDLALLLARLGLGTVLLAHGLAKLEQGFGATADGFDALGIPLPEAAAAYALAAELGGGVLLVVGLLTPLAGLLVVGQMAGAFWFVHRGTEVMASEGGWELVGVIGLLALAIAATGAGRISADGLLAGRRRVPATA